MIGDDGEAVEPIVYTAEVGAVEPPLPGLGAVAAGIEGRSPLGEPEDVDAFVGIFGSPAGDGLHGQGTDLDLDGNGDAAHVGAYVRAGRAKWALQGRPGHAWFPEQRLEDCGFAPAMGVGLAAERAQAHGLVREVGDAAGAGAKKDDLGAFGA